VCTVALLETPGGGYLLGHNRDESRARGRATAPTEREAAGHRYLAPTDADAGGTWITVNDAGVAVCVLNAADVDPARLPEVPESRGRLALDLAGSTRPTDARTTLERSIDRLRGVRAFHVVIVGPDGAGPRTLAEWVRWDGRELRAERVRPPCLFVSALLDQSGAERERGRSWRRFLERPDAATPGALGTWLGNHDPEPGMLSACVHRPDARTVSRTLATVPSSGTIEVRYLDGPPCEPASVESRHRLQRR
jgi:hypothetical protein